MSRRPVNRQVISLFRELYGAWAQRHGHGEQEQPQVGIIDLAGIPTRGEFELFRQAFENVGMPCRVLCPKTSESTTTNSGLATSGSILSTGA